MENPVPFFKNEEITDYNKRSIVSIEHIIEHLNDLKRVLANTNNIIDGYKRASDVETSSAVYDIHVGTATVREASAITYTLGSLETMANNLLWTFNADINGQHWM